MPNTHVALMSTVKAIYRWLETSKTKTMESRVSDSKTGLGKDRISQSKIARRILSVHVPSKGVILDKQDMIKGLKILTYKNLTRWVTRTIFHKILDEL